MDLMDSVVNDMKVEPAKVLLETQNGGDSSNKTYIFGNEDHTLGNVLRHVLMQAKETDFCGYSVPHPYEPKMHMRLQTRNNKKQGKNVDDVMTQGLRDLAKASDVIKNTFEDAMKKFESQR
jgi:DNA-directed RNA polymerases I and III subunit RPAC2